MFRQFWKPESFPKPSAGIIRGILGNWGLLSDAAHYLFGMLKAQIPLLPGRIIVEARERGTGLKKWSAPWWMRIGDLCQKSAKSTRWTRFVWDMDLFPQLS